MPKIFVAGHKGMVGSAICRELAKDRSNQIITADRRSLDLINQVDVSTFLADHQIDYIYLAAAKVGGIHANNTYPAEFIYENLMIQNNVIHSAYATGVSKLLFLGSSCIYPRNASQPMKEEALLSGELEKTNEPYAIAKIAGIKMCDSYNRQYGSDFRSVMPTNLYGPGDNFHPENSHVIPGLIARIFEAKVSAHPVFKAWGTGEAIREFLHVDDMARASIFVHNISRDEYDRSTKYCGGHINVGSGQEIKIRDLVPLIAKKIGYQGTIEWDLGKPDGTPRKLLDSTRLHSLGWEPSIGLDVGLTSAIDAYFESKRR